MNNSTKATASNFVEVTNAFERIVHWFFAGSCIVLFVSGFGLMFQSLSSIAALFGGYYALKYVHNISGLFFCASGLFAVLMWFKEGALLTGDDMKWIAAGGGYLGKAEGIPEPGRFNGGQKLYYILKAVTWFFMSATGFVMWFPFFFSPGLVTTCYPIHALCVVLLAGSVIVHIFLGTIANPGTIDSMLTGKCTRAWAKLQHGKWLKAYDEQSK